MFVHSTIGNKLRLYQTSLGGDIYLKVAGILWFMLSESGILAFLPRFITFFWGDADEKLNGPMDGLGSVFPERSVALIRGILVVLFVILLCFCLLWAIRVIVQTLGSMLQFAFMWLAMMFVYEVMRHVSFAIPTVDVDGIRDWSLFLSNLTEVFNLGILESWLGRILWSQVVNR